MSCGVVAARGVGALQPATPSLRPGAPHPSLPMKAHLRLDPCDGQPARGQRQVSSTSAGRCGSRRRQCRSRGRDQIIHRRAQGSPLLAHDLAHAPRPRSGPPRPVGARRARRARTASPRPTLAFQLRDELHIGPGAVRLSLAGYAVTRTAEPKVAWPWAMRSAEQANMLARASAANWSMVIFMTTTPREVSSVSRVAVVRRRASSAVDRSQRGQVTAEAVELSARHGQYRPSRWCPSSSSRRGGWGWRPSWRRIVAICSRRRRSARSGTVIFSSSMAMYAAAALFKGDALWVSWRWAARCTCRRFKGSAPESRCCRIRYWAKDKPVCVAMQALARRSRSLSEMLLLRGSPFGPERQSSNHCDFGPLPSLASGTV